jgi:hypothetical protein
MSLTKVSHSMISGAPISVLDFGALTTNTDVQNAAAFQAALDSLKNIGGTVLIPSGTFNITNLTMDSTDYKGIRVVGLSAELTKLNFTTTGTAISMVSATFIENCSWENMTIDAPNCNKMFHLVNGSQCSFRKIRTAACGNSGVNAKAYHLQKSMATLFEEVSWVGVTKYGFYVEDDSDANTFLHCYMKGFVTTEYTIVCDTGATQPAHVVTTFQDCIIGGGTQASAVVALTGNCNNVTFINNYFETMVRAIQLGNAAGPHIASEILIKNNYVYETSSDGFLLQASNNVMIEQNNFILITGFDINVNQLDVTKNQNLTIQYNKLTKQIGINAGQNKVRYQDDDGVIRDRLTFTPNDAFFVSFTPGTIPNNSTASTTTTVTGAKLGWIAMASFSLDLAGTTISAAVTAADTVTVTITNNTGGSVTLGAGVSRVLVIPFN